MPQERNTKEIKSLSVGFCTDGFFILKNKSCCGKILKVWRNRAKQVYRGFLTHYYGKSAVFGQFLTMARTRSEGIVVRSGAEESFYSPPFGCKLKRRVEEIIEALGGKLPIFWAQESARFDEFIKCFGHLYDIKESAVDADYI